MNVSIPDTDDYLIFIMSYTTNFSKWSSSIKSNILKMLIKLAGKLSKLGFR